MSLLAILLVTQAEQSSPALSFAWPPAQPSLDNLNLQKIPLPPFLPSVPLPDRASNSSISASNLPSFSRCLPPHPFPSISLSVVPPTSSHPTTYLHFEPDEWAAMLTPARLGNCPRPPNPFHGPPSPEKLELVIDALAIIAHPVLISQKPLLPNTDAPVERGRTRTRSGEKDMVGSLELPPLGHNNSSPLPDPSFALSHPSLLAKFPLVPPPLPSPSLQRSASRPPVSQLTRMMTRANITSIDGPSNPLLSHPRSLFSTRSTSSPSPVPGHPRRVPPQRYPTYSPILPPPSTAPFPLGLHSPLTPIIAPAQMVPLQSFTLALVIDAPPASQLSQLLELYYYDVVLKLTAALKLLERQSSYLTREVHRITSTQAERHDSESSRSASQNKRTGTSEMMRLIEQSSDLARALASVYEGLNAHGKASIKLDGQLPIDLLLHDELLRSDAVPDDWLVSNSTRLPSPDGDWETKEQDRFAHMEAWKSLLLLEDPNTLVEQTAPQSLLGEFIKLIKPGLALADYKHLLHTDSSTIRALTHHLVYFRKALLVDLVSLEHSYQMVPCPPLQPLSILSDDFSARFPQAAHLVVVLSKIGKRPRRSMEEVLEFIGNDGNQKMEVLVWLLKHGLVRRERTYVRLKVDRQTKLRVAARSKACSESPPFQLPRSQTHGPPTQPVRVPPPSSPFTLAGPRTASLPLITTTNATPELHGQSETTSQSCLLRFSTAATTTTAASSSSLSTTATIKQQQFRTWEVGTDVLAFGGTQGTEVGSFGSVVSAMKMKRRSRRTFVRMGNMIASSFWSKREEEQRQEEGEEAKDDVVINESIVGDPGKLTEVERLWIEEICSGKSELEQSLFKLTLKYFNGKHSIEEIVSRSGLMENNKISGSGSSYNFGGNCSGGCGCGCSCDSGNIGGTGSSGRGYGGGSGGGGSLKSGYCFSSSTSSTSSSSIGGGIGVGGGSFSGTISNHHNHNYNHHRCCSGSSMSCCCCCFCCFRKKFESVVGNGFKDVLIKLVVS